jgi:AcrR family transcriptional regulator
MKMRTNRDLRESLRVPILHFERSFEGPESAMQNYDYRKDHLLSCAARVFARDGYDRTSMRDLARESQMSLAGMYYYVQGKGDLLYQIQKACFEAVAGGARGAVAGEDTPEGRLTAFIRHHVTFFATHMAEMKVLAHEDESLAGDALLEVRRLKKDYVDLCVELLGAIDGAGAADETRRRVAAYTLFGMMNWMYTWYDPDGPLGAAELADTITKLFLNGYSVEVAAR